MNRQTKKGKATILTIFEQSLDGIAIFKKGEIFYINKTLSNLFGLSKNEIYNYKDYSPSPVSQVLDRARNELLKKEELRFESLVQKLDGTSRLIECLGKANVLPGYHFTTIRDITARRTDEELLRKTDRLDTASQLAICLAHEIRNPLTTLKGFVQLMLSQTTTSVKMHQYGQIMLNEIANINDLASQLLLLTDLECRQNHKESVNQLLKQTIKLIQLKTYTNRNINVKFDEQDTHIEGHQLLLKQAFFNILKYCTESIPKHKSVNMQTNIRRDIQSVLIRFESEGKFLTDNQIKHIGEPLYNLKEEDYCLELMVSYLIIYAHNGHVEVRPCEAGTVFDVTMPLCLT